MRKLLFSQLTWDDLAGLVKLSEHRIQREPWEELAQAPRGGAVGQG